MRIAYGMKVMDEGDPYVEAVEAGSAAFGEAFVPGAFLVETFPILRHIPDWFPGAGFKQTAKAWRKTLDLMCDQPHNWVKQQMVRVLNLLLCGNAHIISCLGCRHRGTKLHFDRARGRYLDRTRRNHQERGLLALCWWRRHGTPLVCLDLCMVRTHVTAFCIRWTDGVIDQRVLPRDDAAP